MKAAIVFTCCLAVSFATNSAFGQTRTRKGGKSSSSGGKSGSTSISINETNGKLEITINGKKYRYKSWEEAERSGVPEVEKLARERKSGTGLGGIGGPAGGFGGAPGGLGGRGGGRGGIPGLDGMPWGPGGNPFKEMEDEIKRMQDEAAKMRGGPDRHKTTNPTNGVDKNVTAALNSSFVVSILNPSHATQLLEKCKQSIGVNNFSVSETAAVLSFGKTAQAALLKEAFSAEIANSMKATSIPAAWKNEKSIRIELGDQAAADRLNPKLEAILNEPQWNGPATEQPFASIVITNEGISLCCDGPNEYKQAQGLLKALGLVTKKL